MDSRTLGRSLLLVVVILSVGALAWKRLAPAPQAMDGMVTSVESADSSAVTVAAETSPAIVEETPAMAVDADTETFVGTPPVHAAKAVEPGKPAVIQVVYFHTNFRCQTCTAIEQQSGDAVQAAFAPELKAGRLTWATCNLDKAGNEHFEQDFELTSASLVLTDGRGPKGRWKVLEKTWDLVGDSSAFSDYVLGETRAFLAATR